MNIIIKCVLTVVLQCTLLLAVLYYSPELPQPFYITSLISYWVK